MEQVQDADDILIVMTLRIWQHRDRFEHLIFDLSKK